MGHAQTINPKECSEGREISSTTEWMLAAAPNFQDPAPFSLFAILATVFASFFGRTNAYAMRTFSRCFSHQSKPPVCLSDIQVVGGCRRLMLGLNADQVKTKE